MTKKNRYESGVYCDPETPNDLEKWTFERVFLDGIEHVEVSHLVKRRDAKKFSARRRVYMRAEVFECGYLVLNSEKGKRS